jgi:hypothetical protein
MVSELEKYCIKYNTLVLVSGTEIPIMNRSFQIQQQTQWLKSSILALWNPPHHLVLFRVNPDLSNFISFLIYKASDLFFRNIY